jgi:hypothetical protein
MMRALVKLNLSRSLADSLGEDIAAAVSTLEKKGRLTDAERRQVKTNVTH